MRLAHSDRLAQECHDYDLDGNPIAHEMSLGEKIDRYLALVDWARRRYTESGRLTTHIGGRATRYTQIESAAAGRYLRCRG
jgi:hypothetical protein